jgi:N-acetylglucosamine-6-phosphate deacetylase
MMKAYLGARIFDGQEWRDGSALLVEEGVIAGICAEREVTSNVETVDLGGGMLVPGFVDLQVNGGGGVLLNDTPTLDGIRTICAAHARFGTTALLPTLITDTPEVTRAAIEAGIEAAEARVPGFLGLHLEGPHLSVSRKGAHDPKLIRPMDDGDVAALTDAVCRLPVLLTTVSPETVPPDRIAALVAAGVKVSLGHSDTSFAVAAAAQAAGATLVTHLFNAMSPLAHRDPGLVGAALESGSAWAGLIADGFHVDRHAIAIALRAKNGPGRIFLVTDAMATIGTELDEFFLNGRRIKRQGGRLTLEDGTLAGADLDMISAVRFMHREMGLSLDEALRMASLYPAQAIGKADVLGHFRKGSAASMVHLTDALDIACVWTDGNVAAH